MYNCHINFFFFLLGLCFSSSNFFSRALRRACSSSLVGELTTVGVVLRGDLVGEGSVLGTGESLSAIVEDTPIYYSICYYS